MPAKTCGAGTGNLTILNTAPHKKPVNVDKIISFIFLPFSYMGQDPPLRSHLF